MLVLLPLPSLPSSLPSSLPTAKTGGDAERAEGGEGATSEGPAAASVHVDVMLPLREALRHRMPVTRVTVPAGGALALHGGMRWQLADDAPCACVLFEYSLSERGAAAGVPASALELASERVADGASAALRAAWALALRSE